MEDVFHGLPWIMTTKRGESCFLVHSWGRIAEWKQGVKWKGDEGEIKLAVGRVDICRLEQPRPNCRATPYRKPCQYYMHLETQLNELTRLINLHGTASPTKAWG